MPPKKKTGRAAAEAAYANLQKENRNLVGDVGEAFDEYLSVHEAANAARERYEEARAAAVRGGAVTNDQLDQMGYRKTSKLPAPPARPANSAGGETQQPAKPVAQTNGAAPAPELASVGAGTGEGS